MTPNRPIEIGDLVQMRPENLVFWVRKIVGEKVLGECCTRRGGHTVISVPIADCTLWDLEQEIPEQ